MVNNVFSADNPIIRGAIRRNEQCRIADSIPDDGRVPECFPRCIPECKSGLQRGGDVTLGNFSKPSLNDIREGESDNQGDKKYCTEGSQLDSHLTPVQKYENDCTDKKSRPAGS